MEPAQLTRKGGASVHGYRPESAHLLEAQSVIRVMVWICGMYSSVDNKRVDPQSVCPQIRIFATVISRVYGSGFEVVEARCNRGGG